MAESTRPRWRRWAARLGRAGLAMGIGVGVVALVFAVVVAILYRKHVVTTPGPHVERSHIRSIIAQESPVYFRDGTHRVGVFFEAEHRQYVGGEDLPLSWVMGIVATEDAAFFSHRGIDPRGIARAMRDNLRAGTVVAGGSTLTQQTAKNLYYRPDRSVRSKGVELLNALRLERHYDKTEILTFYANQFHVTGNGRGLAIAARHFFDKDLADLEVVEGAFLAGLVKAPSRYDPFLGDEARRAGAIEKAHARTRHVLGRIAAVPAEALIGPPPGAGASEAARAAWTERLERGRRIQATAQHLLDTEIALHFERGTFRYDASAVLDEVARRLTEPPFDTVLERAGIDDPATAGLQVVTTLDYDAQRAATYGLWHHLTEVGIQLEGHTAEALRLDARAPRFDPDRPPLVREIRRAAVVGEREVDGKRTLDLDLGGHGCHVDREGLVRVAASVVKGAKGERWTRAQTADVDAVVDALPPGSVVLASVRAVGAEAQCDLELRPTLQGAVMVQERGEIRAMIGGNDNRNFNRATALRQMGSTWKPLVFHAAMQLGWSPSDPLDNTRQVFPFSTTFYYPRPDHDPEPSVSMSWAGVNSENLASVWLLYHLADKLDGEQVRALAGSLGLARGEEESERDYRTRIQKAGVLPTRARVAEARFLQARHEVLGGIENERHPEDRLALQSLLYGWGHGNERERVALEEPGSRAWKERALANSWRTLEPMMSPCALQYRALSDAHRAGLVPDPEAVPDLSVFVDGDLIQVACGAIPEGYVTPAEALDDWVEPVPVDTRGWLQRLRGDPVPSVGPLLVSEADVRVGERLHLSTLRAVSASLKRRALTESLQTEPPGLYDPELLYWHQDFRVLLALRYVASLAEQYGVQTEIPPVLSLPLGATEITLEEATSVYGGLVSGVAWSFPGQSDGLALEPPPSPALLIAEIRDVDGQLLYQAQPVENEVGGPGTGALTAHILRNVVRHGTGRRALALTAGGRQLPVGGKTGTTNDFRNAAFLGFAPRWDAGSFRAEAGYAVGVYVGYDDNTPLVNGALRLAGSSGALPAWVETIAGLRDAGLLGEPVATVGWDGTVSAQWPLAWSHGLLEVPVDPTTGLLLAEPRPEALDGEGPVVLAPQQVVPEVDYHPIQRPPRLFPRTEDWERGPANRADR